MKERINDSEMEQDLISTVEYNVYKPGGNDTALVTGVVRDVEKRKVIADKLLRMYPNVEQVGFVNLDSQNAELMMTGGEFCGNATRSTAYAALKGEPGELMIKVSGVKNKLRAGVTESGEAFSQMPIYSDVSKVHFDKNGNAVVEMEGITHFVNFDPEEVAKIKEMTVEERKVVGRLKMKELDIDESPACGIIYAEKQGNNYAIYPVVYVKDADTLYYETACGSGTTALGLTLSLREQCSIEKMPIRQPSGMDIKFSIEFDGSEFGYAQIEGEINVLEKDKKMMPLEQIKGLDAVDVVLEEGSLIQLYKDCFSKPPYYEKFSDEDVKSYFAEYAAEGSLFLSRDEKGKVIGFSASLPIQTESITEIKSILGDANLNLNNCVYIADLGVDEAYRRNGLARQLIQELIDATKDNSLLVMRTSVDNVASQRLHRSLGFRDVEGVFQYVDTPKEIEGQLVQIADKRLFLMREK